MIDAGLVEETRGLLDRGYGLELTAMASPGYREIGLHLSGQLDLDEAIARTKVATHQLARRQYTWFPLRDRRIHWFEGSAESLPAILEELELHRS